MVSTSLYDVGENTDGQGHRESHWKANRHLFRKNYLVAIQLSSAPEMTNVQLGLYVKYDARERLQASI
ncbi:hypothetical protein OESDEN_14589 [Oesophagostomum dentatum]|uniref:Uncharacterized protein n=1 Tax=Oesophagostomum dentatum TaxID=61180 RepID=A0A0B1SL94_OESDE|nr:hypothetical protein OESDEN_14589 [Oesophagostomum dentatum]